MKPHPLYYLVEPLLELPNLVERQMFGCRALYLSGKLQLVLAAQEQPWHGILIATDFKHHQSLQADFPCLSQHPVLKKWLYLPEDNEEFESCSAKIVARIVKEDPRIGVMPEPRKKKLTTSRQTTTQY